MNADHLAGIDLVGGETSVRNDFGEILPASIRGHVFADPEADCKIGPNDILLKDVKVELLDVNGIVVGTTFTDANGEYSFGNLRPGTYSVREYTPAGYFQGGQVKGDAGGNDTTPDLISQISLGSGINAVNYDFCELIPDKSAVTFGLILKGTASVEQMMSSSLM